MKPKAKPEEMTRKAKREEMIRLLAERWEERPDFPLGRVIADNDLQRGRPHRHR